MKKLKFGRFTYSADFAYSADEKAPNIFGYVRKDGRIFNCDEDPKTKEAICGKVEFTNIDLQKVYKSVGPASTGSLDVPILINWWDCRIDPTINSCIR